MPWHLGPSALPRSGCLELAAQTGYDGAPSAEGLADFFVDREVQVALAVAELDVLESVPFLGQGAVGLGQ